MIVIGISYLIWDVPSLKFYQNGSLRLAMIFLRLVEWLIEFLKKNKQINWFLIN